jgi:hypothetical protein
MVGVSFNKSMQKWTARARNTHIGVFETEREAEVAREHFLQDNERALSRVPKLFFSLTASNSIFTMANFPTTRRMRDANR